MLEMDVLRQDGIVNSAMSVADKIRALADGGHSRADIARMLGKRYQHVRNVLEADKLPRAGARARAVVGGVEEASSTFNGVHRLVADADGRIRLPAEVLAVLGGASGVLIGELEEDAFVILSAKAAALRARKRVMSASRDPSRVLSDELIMERRAEAAREDG
jgi:hypothetical protein